MKRISALRSILEKLTQGNGGILAADESYPTLQKRFADLNIPYTEATRQTYRKVLLTTPGLEKYINGVILFEETLTQTDQNNILFTQLLHKKNILPGIKVDQGLVPLSSNNKENITRGLDTLMTRLKRYYEAGARFTKWRAAFRIQDSILPSDEAVKVNSEILAYYAACSQTQGMIPIVEPEVLREGPHTLERCQAVTEQVLHEVFYQLSRYHVNLECLILKPNMITPGSQYVGDPQEPTMVAQATLEVLRRTVPAAVPSINFLSGGQTPEQATIHLKAINSIPITKPWRLSFSYARALQQQALEIWGRAPSNVQAAQNILYQVAQSNYEACSQVNRK
jgi:fructose-bisphosphate aldolase, class I